MNLRACICFGQVPCAFVSDFSGLEVASGKWIHKTFQRGFCIVWCCIGCRCRGKATAILQELNRENNMQALIISILKYGRDSELNLQGGDWKLPLKRFSLLFGIE